MTEPKTNTSNMGAPCDTEHDFVLVLAGVTDLTPEQEDVLFEAGCDDATISLRFGTIYLTFARFAPTLKEAVLTALRDVRRANIGAAVRYIDECNLVTQAEIAPDQTQPPARPPVHYWSARAEWFPGPRLLHHRGETALAMVRGRLLVAPEQHDQGRHTP